MRHSPRFGTLALVCLAVALLALPLAAQEQTGALEGRVVEVLPSTLESWAPMPSSSRRIKIKKSSSEEGDMYVECGS